VRALLLGAECDSARRLHLRASSSSIPGVSRASTGDGSFEAEA
jgi:hypothetical protein